MEKTRYQSANYEQRNKTIVKSSAAKNNNNNNNNYYDSEKYQMDVKKTDNDIVPVSKEEEYTKSKKIINHKTRQIETRIQRQIVMEDGKVIADSGPQVTQRTKEDVKTEELEGENRKGKGDPKEGPEGYIALPGESVVSEKTETHNTTRTARQEQLQYHDESIKELTGLDIHRKALVSPNELIKLDGDGEIDSENPRGKLMHYSAKSKTFADREEVKEISKKQRDGSITTEKTRTHHHEELDDDELPEDSAELAALPEASAETRKEVSYHRDWDSFDRQAVEDRRSDSHSRYSSMERKPASLDRRSKERSEPRETKSCLQTETRSEQQRKERFMNREKVHEIPVASAEYKRPSSRMTSPPRSRLDSYGYSSKDRADSSSRYYKQSELQRTRDESRHSIRSNRSNIPKEDASVQASFSEDSSDDEAYGRSQSRTKHHETEREQQHRIRVETRSDARKMEAEKPRSTYYFGDGYSGPRSGSRPDSRPSSRRSPSPIRTPTNDRREEERKREEMQMAEERHRTSSSLGHRTSSRLDERKENLDWFESDARTLMAELERECRSELPIRDSSQNRSIDDVRPISSTSGEIKANVKHEYKSTANGKVLSDTARSENFHRSFASPEERDDATKSFNRLMDDTFTISRDFSPSLSDRYETRKPLNQPDSGVSYKVPIVQSERDSGYKADYSRSQSRDKYTRSFTPYRSTSPSPARSSRERSSNLNSPDRSPERRGTWTKSTAPMTSSSRKDDWPEFSSRSSPLLRSSNNNNYETKRDISKSKTGYEYSSRRQYADEY